MKATQVSNDRQKYPENSLGEGNNHREILRSQVRGCCDPGSSGRRELTPDLLWDVQPIGNSTTLLLKLCIAHQSPEGLVTMQIPISAGLAEA